MTRDEQAWVSFASAALAGALAKGDNLTSTVDVNMAASYADDMLEKFQEAFGAAPTGETG